ncbi:MAG: hypothetical protein LBQ83_01210 [Candidatus Margulisbacteria bacterium]|jgi:hypothetical protein|nr:hypothetical protein [Candidatus Margulisiibacteriota bacterium]
MTNAYTYTSDGGVKSTAAKKLSGKEAKASDYNETRANLLAQRNARQVTANAVPAAVGAGQRMEAAQLTNLRAATKGLVQYGSGCNDTSRHGTDAGSPFGGSKEYRAHGT